MKQCTKGSFVSVFPIVVAMIMAENVKKGGNNIALFAMMLGAISFAIVNAGMWKT